MKKIFLFLLIFSLVLVYSTYPTLASDMEPEEDENIIYETTNLDADSISAKAAVLFEANTGTLLFEKNALEALPPASVTKIMTLLLVCEALANGSVNINERVIISNNAASMGGSQVFLEEGEEFSVEELLKCTIIASANDAAVALAELISGSEEAFVNKMNSRALDLGLKNTYFENATGLDDDVQNHLTSAYDIALMSKELLKHDIILKYSGLWQDSIRDGEFVLTNTNRLVRFYPGCTGLKTGSTDKAGYCVSASAKRGDMHLVAVIMGAETRDARNDAARTLLDWGFANYALYSEDASYLEEVDIYRSTCRTTQIYMDSFKFLCPKGDVSKIEKRFEIPDFLIAPIGKDSSVGKVMFYLGEEKIGECDIYIKEEIKSISRFELFTKILRSTFNASN